MSASPASLLKSKMLADMESAKNSQALKKAKLGVKKFPEDPDFWSMAGFVLQSEKQFKKAAQYFLGAAKLRPGDEKDIENLVYALELSNQVTAAEKYLTKTIEKYPENIQFAMILGNLIARGKRWHDLIEFATDGLSRFPAKIGLLTLRGTAYAQLGRNLLSFQDRKHAYSLSPTHPMAAKLYATSLHQQGRKSEAKQIFSSFVNKDPNDLNALYEFSQLATSDEARDLLKSIDQISIEEQYEEDLLYYAKARLVTTSQDLSSALPLFAKANAIRSTNHPYDSEKEDRFFELSGNCIETTRTAKGHPKLGTSVPIFIVGQPRSGTTLLEMMLSSADDVYGCGELPAIGFFCKRYLDDEQKFSNLEAESLAGYYVDNLPKFPEKIKAFVDKMPHNYQRIGYILSAIPNAKIVHILRDPRDTALSTWIQRFSDTGLSHAYDWHAMAHSANLYRRYMNLWQSKFESQILTVQYEHLTSAPETVMRQVVEHCGIEWDPAMISPERNKGTVRTASIDQVRSKISSKSVGKWKQAEEELRPFLASLDNTLWPEYDL
jgi:tetratricopeptide (TPR) repeat protein